MIAAFFNRAKGGGFEWPGLFLCSGFSELCITCFLIKCTVYKVNVIVQYICNYYFHFLSNERAPVSNICYKTVNPINRNILIPHTQYPLYVFLEYYVNTSLENMNLQNIHNIRSSYTSLRTLLNEERGNINGFAL